MIQFSSSAVEKLENWIISEDHKAQRRQARTSRNNEMSLTQRNLQLISWTSLLGLHLRRKLPKKIGGTLFLKHASKFKQAKQWKPQGTVLPLLGIRVWGLLWVFQLKFLGQVIPVTWAAEPEVEAERAGCSYGLSVFLWVSSISSSEQPSFQVSGNISREKITLRNTEIFSLLHRHLSRRQCLSAQAFGRPNHLDILFPGFRKKS